MSPSTPTAACRSEECLVACALDGAAFELRPGTTREVRLATPEDKARVMDTLFGLRPVRPGELSLFGRDAADLAPDERLALNRRLAAVFAEGGLISNLRVWENLVLPACWASRTGPSPFEAEALELFDDLGLDADLAGRLPSRLTCFERKAIAFVRGLLTHPDAMVFDSVLEHLSEEERRRAARFEELFRARCMRGAILRIEVAHARAGHHA